MSEAFEKNSAFFEYVRWHYGRGLKEYFGVAGNFLWFVAHFFSFKLLIKTLFSPWKRLGESYGNGLNLSRYAETFIVNTLMRAVGFFTRVIVLVLGLASYVLVLTLSFLGLLIWILAPAVVIGSIVLAITFYNI